MCNFSSCLSGSKTNFYICSQLKKLFDLNRQIDYNMIKFESGKCTVHLSRDLRIRMQFNMQRLERSRLQIKPSSIDKGPKNVIFQFFKKLGAIATVVAPQIKFSSNPSRFEELENTAITGVVLQTDDGPTFYFVGTCSNNFTYYWIYYSGTAKEISRSSNV